MKQALQRMLFTSIIVTLISGFILFNCNSTETGKDSGTLTNKVVFSSKGNERVIMTSSIPKNFENTFPNSNNPNSPTNQQITITLPLSPQKGTNTIMGSTTTLGSNYANTGLEQRGGRSFTKIGIAIDGVLIEPGTAEVWNPDTKRQGRVNEVSDVQWSYDGLGAERSGSFVGMDKYKGHVQPTGLYHYHAITHNTGLYVDDPNVASPLVAFAADGFPIFGPYGYDESGDNIIKMYGNYKLKNNGGARQSRNGQNPSGNYDGTFIQDYEFAAGTADVDVLEEGAQVSILDIANGHVGKVSAEELEKYNFSKEYLGEKNESDNTYTVYHYHVTPNYPYVPRSLYGTPDESFQSMGNMSPPPKDNDGRPPQGPPPGGQGRQGMGKGPNR